MRGLGEEIDKYTGDDVVVRISAKHIILEIENGEEFMNITTEKEALLVLNIIESAYDHGFKKKSKSKN